MNTTNNRTRFTLGALLLVCLLPACSKTEQQAAAPTGTDLGGMALQTFDAATSTFQDLQGRGLELSSFEGKRVFINYWATWCAPCIRELPALSRAAEELADENFLFLFASDETPEKIADFVAERGFSGNFIKLNTFFGAYGIDAVPSSSVYDENGELLHTWPGAYEWDSAEMLGQVRAAVE